MHISMREMMLNVFNVLFNVGARNKEEIKSLINWTKKKNIDIRHVTAAKGWFEISTLKAIKPLFIANVGVFFSCVLTMLLLSNFYVAGIEAIRTSTIRRRQVMGLD
ncbi:hypothetical protein [Klebsiella pneumoniae IS46]|nr:hypothetical protein [Klebsiella pneumoniae IS46]